MHKYNRLFLKILIEIAERIPNNLQFFNNKNSKNRAEIANKNTTKQNIEVLKKI